MLSSHRRFFLELDSSENVRLRGLSTLFSLVPEEQHAKCISVLVFLDTRSPSEIDDSRNSHAMVRVKSEILLDHAYAVPAIKIIDTATS